MPNLIRHPGGEGCLDTGFRRYGYDYIFRENLKSSFATIKIKKTLDPLASNNYTMDMKVIGLTGNIGCGKSTVARFLQELGADCIDADKVGHEIYNPGTPGWLETVEAFWPGHPQPGGDY
jgi:hypothetical protein